MDEDKDYTVNFYFGGIDGRIEVQAKDEHNAIKRASIKLYILLDSDRFEVADVERD